MTKDKDVLALIKDLSDQMATVESTVHQTIGDKATEILKRWTQPCGACNVVAYKVCATEIKKIGSNHTIVLAHIVCANCGAFFFMCPLEVTEITEENQNNETTIGTDQPQGSK